MTRVGCVAVHMEAWLFVNGHFRYAARDTAADRKTYALPAMGRFALAAVPALAVTTDDDKAGNTPTRPVRKTTTTFTIPK
jgi:hypothetical protein